MALILIADDDEIVIEIVRAALSARGHIVGAVDDGLPVLGVVELKRPAVVILDCLMPELSGIEALRQIRASQTCSETPVVMLTSRRATADEAIARWSGASDYVRKPFDPADLVSRVEAFLPDPDPEPSLMPPPPVATPAAERRWGQR